MGKQLTQSRTLSPAVYYGINQIAVTVCQTGTDQFLGG